VAAASDIYSSSFDHGAPSPLTGLLQSNIGRSETLGNEGSGSSADVRVF
jgi:hypothetical protein